MYDFKKSKEQWSSPPFDDIGYLSSSEWLNKSKKEIFDIIEKCEKNRYQKSGRNFENKWRRCLGLDTTFNKKIMDFGCGIGIESLQFARNGNKIILADISESNLLFSERVLNVFGFESEEKVEIYEDAPFFDYEEKVDIFYSNGVLHHTPKIVEILRRATEILSDEGEIRLMLYSDNAWKIKVGYDPNSKNVLPESDYLRFTKGMDGVGHYADWYDFSKLEKMVEPYLNIISFDYITDNAMYCVCVLRPK